MEEEAMLRRHNSAASVAILPNEVMLEIVSWLPVKHVMQLRCLNKFFNTLIFDPFFVQMHLNKSAQNSQIAFMCCENHHSCLATLSVHRLLENQLTTFHQSDPYFLLDDVSRLRRHVIGSCNGLLLVGMLYGWLSIWNPAMRTKSENLTILPNSTLGLDEFCKFSFGYDNSTRTYKVVVFYVEVKRGCIPKSVVKIFSLGDISWRDIQCFPVLPLQWSYPYNNNGVHLNGTINWLAFRDYNSSAIADQYSSVTVDQCVILSLNLSTETYTQLLLPQSFDKVHKCHRPKISVLMDRLCFCHDFEVTHFVIWQMKDFGVQHSWIQLFKISYESFAQVNLLPLYLSVNGDTLVLANDKLGEAFIYNCRDNKVEEIGITNIIEWSQAKIYVESLVSTKFDNIIPCMARERGCCNGRCC